MKKILIYIFILILLTNPVKNPAQTNINTAAKSSNNFAISLFNRLDQNKNLFFSPLSISTALAIAVNGARGTTLKSIKSTLKIKEDLNLQNNDFKNFLTLLNINRMEDSMELSIANSLWMQQDYKFNKSFVEIAKDYYGSELNQINFKLSAELENSRNKVNNWVQEKTNDRIKDLIKPGILDTTTRLIIVNAIYFKGRWLYQFDENFTIKETFYSINNKVSANYMKLNETAFKYYEGNEFKMLELPYLGEEFSMIIILPEIMDGISDLESNFSLENYIDWSKNLKQEIVDVSIPKFKLESEFNLSKVLSKMGMEVAFSDKADFTGMLDSNSEAEKLKIKDVIHKSFIEVNEVGTEASAATAVQFAYETGNGPSVENKKTFKADHPFIFLIKENTSNAILFLGRIMNPQTE
ncbi:MAG: serpin family protein [bacterium]